MMHRIVLPASAVACASFTVKVHVGVEMRHSAGTVSRLGALEATL